MARTPFEGEPYGQGTADQGLRAVLAARQREVNQGLHLILLPTEACNFRCVYCYETFEYHRMEDWVVRGVRNLINRRAGGLHSLTLSWFGGEPLLALGIIDEILVHAKSAAGSGGRLRLRSDITTNGYLLTAPTFSRLVDLGVTEYQISLDGPKHLHDRKRVMAGGRGTFDRIWANLRSMQATRLEFKVIVRIHVDRENAPGLPGFLRDCAEAFGGDSRFEVFLRPLGRFGGANDHLLQILDDEEADRVIGDLKTEASRLGIPQFDTERDGDVCYAARANSFVVRANGRLNKCTLALESPANQIGRIREDGSMLIENRLMAGWLRGHFTGNQEELSCPMVGLAGVDAARPARALGAGAPDRSIPLTLTPSP
jgi:uncharacterized protein